MPIFEIKKDKLSLIEEEKISLEKDLQKITEENLEAVFGLGFVKSEMALDGFRIDTLAFDKETNSFVIIEYKRDKSFSVVDQGFAYLALMLNNKADFILEYNENCKDNLKRENVDWQQSRVLFLANSFTKYQQNAINFKDLPIEIWEVKKYENNTLLYKQIVATDTKESIKTVTKDKTIESVSQEIKKYSLDDILKPDWEKTKEIFDELRDRIFSIDSRIEENVKKQYIGYKISGLKWNICAIKTFKSKLVVVLIRVEKDDLKDPDKKLEKVEWGKMGWGKQCSYTINDSEDIDYAMFLIKQVYDKFYK